MSFWKQILLAIPVLVAGLAIWITYVPSALPVLERAGLLESLESLGMPVPQAAAPAQGGRQGGFARGPTTVIAAPPGEGVLNDNVAAIGSGQAVRSVVVTPEVSGRLTEIAVSSGQRVETGQVIARLDSEAEQIARDRARLVVTDAGDRADRVARLQRTGAATDLQIRETELALRQAELALRQTEFDLARRLIEAPITGWVGIINAEIGMQVSAATELTQIDDRSEILVDFRVPERFVGLIQRGDSVVARPLARPGMALQGVVSALDNRVDPGSRMLLVQARLPNDDDSLRAGMSFSISIAMPGEVYPAVDPLSVQWGSDGSFVWVVREGRAQRLPIRIVQRTADAVLVRAEFQADDLVVIEGVQALRPGAEVQVTPPPDDTRGQRGGARAETERSRI